MPKFRVWEDYAVVKRWERVIEAATEEEALEVFEAWRDNESGAPTSELYMDYSDDSGIEDVE